MQLHGRPQTNCIRPSGPRNPGGLRASVPVGDCRPFRRRRRALGPFSGILPPPAVPEASRRLRRPQRAPMGPRRGFAAFPPIGGPGLRLSPKTGPYHIRYWAQKCRFWNLGARNRGQRGFCLQSPPWGVWGVPGLRREQRPRGGGTEDGRESRQPLYASVPLPDYLVQFVRWDETPTDSEPPPWAVGGDAGGGQVRHS